jgi:hypothetical protein
VVSFITQPLYTRGKYIYGEGDRFIEDFGWTTLKENNNCFGGDMDGRIICTNLQPVLMKYSVRNWP